MWLLLVLEYKASVVTQLIQLLTNVLPQVFCCLGNTLVLISVQPHTVVSCWSNLPIHKRRCPPRLFWHTLCPSLLPACHTPGLPSTNTTIGAWKNGRKETRTCTCYFACTESPNIITIVTWFMWAAEFSKLYSCSLMSYSPTNTIPPHTHSISWKFNIHWSGFIGFLLAK